MTRCVDGLKAETRSPNNVTIPGADPGPAQRNTMLTAKQEHTLVTSEGKVTLLLYPDCNKHLLSARELAKIAIKEWQIKIVYDA